MAIAAVGIVISTLAATGVPVKFGVLLTQALGQSMLVALLLVAGACIVLGMGMPTLARLRDGGGDRVAVDEGLWSGAADRAHVRLLHRGGLGDHAAGGDRGLRGGGHLGRQTDRHRGRGVAHRHHDFRRARLPSPTTR